MHNDLDQTLLVKCFRGIDIRGSDRPGDRAKQRLRNAGLIEYTGKPKRWIVTETGKVTAGALIANGARANVA